MSEENIPDDTAPSNVTSGYLHVENPGNVPDFDFCPTPFGPVDVGEGNDPSFTATWSDFPIYNTEDRIKESLEGYLDSRKSINSSITVDGKTIAEWKKYFTVTLPPNPNETQRKSALAECSKFFNEVYKQLMVSRATLAVLEKEFDSRVSVEVRRLSEDYRSRGRSLPPNSTLQAVAKAFSKNGLDTLTIAQIVHGMWQDILDSLKTTMKIIEELRHIAYIETKGGGSY